LWGSWLLQVKAADIAGHSKGRSTHAPLLVLLLLHLLVRYNAGAQPQLSHLHISLSLLCSLPPLLLLCRLAGVLLRRVPSPSLTQPLLLAWLRLPDTPALTAGHPCTDIWH
jgi:hypothetical protein